MLRLLGVSGKFREIHTRDDAIATVTVSTHDGIDRLLVPRFVAVGTEQHLQSPHPVWGQSHIDGVELDDGPSPRAEVFLYERGNLPPCPCIEGGV
jgi:hypothetical protein